MESLIRNLRGLGLNYEPGDGKKSGPVAGEEILGVEEDLGELEEEEGDVSGSGEFGCDRVPLKVTRTETLGTLFKQGEIFPKVEARGQGKGLGSSEVTSSVRASDPGAEEDEGGRWWRRRRRWWEQHMVLEGIEIERGLGARLRGE